MDADLQKKFIEVIDEYRAKFDEGFVYQEGCQIDIEEWIKQVRRCIETNTPYKYPELPEGCIA